MEKIELTDEIKEQLKEEAGGRPLFKKTIAGQDFVFTYLTRSQYVAIQQWIADNQDSVTVAHIDEKVVGTALLWPKLTPQQWAMLPAGVVPNLSVNIQEKSYIRTDNVESFREFSVEDLSPGTFERRTISEEEKEKLKATVPHALRLVRILGNDYIIRPMLRPEYSALQKLPRDSDSEAEGVKRCVVWPKNLNLEELPAGIPTQLANQIMAISGFLDEGIIEEL